jgi:hypothetical protein
VRGRPPRSEACAPPSRPELVSTKPLESIGIAPCWSPAESYNVDSSARIIAGVFMALDRVRRTTVAGSAVALASALRG